VVEVAVELAVAVDVAVGVAVADGLVVAVGVAVGVLVALPVVGCSTKGRNSRWSENAPYCAGPRGRFVVSSA
jgi:hypothetical protein